MGYYTTHFDGVITVEPPLNDHEISYLTKFADTTRMVRPEGPYYVEEPRPDRGPEAVPLYFDTLPTGEPSTQCHWEPTEDGTGIRFNGSEKFEAPTEWMEYLIEVFLKPAATVQTSMPEPGWDWPDELNHFQGHVLNGVLLATGDDHADVWRLVITNNTVSSKS